VRSWLVWSTTAALTGLLLWQAGTALAESLALDEAHPAYVLQQQADGRAITLKVASPQSGPNILRVRIEDGGAIDPAVQQVVLYPNMPGHEMLLLAGSVTAERTPEGEFRADTGVFEMFGTWDLVVEVQRSTGAPATASFAFQLAPSRPQMALFAGVPLTLLVLGLVAVIVMWRKSVGSADAASNIQGDAA